MSLLYLLNFSIFFPGIHFRWYLCRLYLLYISIKNIDICVLLLTFSDSPPFLFLRYCVIFKALSKHLVSSHCSKFPNWWNGCRWIPSLCLNTPLSTQGVFCFVYFCLLVFYYILLYISLRCTAQWFDFYIIYAVIPPISVVPTWHYTSLKEFSANSHKCMLDYIIRKGKIVVIEKKNWVSFSWKAPGNSWNTWDDYSFSKGRDGRSCVPLRGRII